MCVLIVLAVDDASLCEQVIRELVEPLAVLTAWSLLHKPFGGHLQHNMCRLPCAVGHIW
jgi:hypothetical protein